ncbi:MAG: cytochrome c-type biogenesis protein CcmH [Gemmatimonadetes bacterium]|nr:cytochrome c-type biogenesis protein CcmH [Gemmatimonadota bacterium]
MSRVALGIVAVAAMLLAAPVARAQSAAQTAKDAASQAPAAVRPPPGGTISAADSVLEARTSALASTLRCPVCQGLSIQDSPSELAQQMRSVVRDHLAAGKTDREVRAYFISKYGEWILLSPQPYGFNLLVYALPVFLLVGGLGFVVMKVRSWTAVSANGVAAEGAAAAIAGQASEPEQGTASPVD